MVVKMKTIRKRKLKKGRILFAIIILIIIVTLPIYFLIPKNYGYTKEAIAIFKEDNVYNKIKERKIYSKTLDVVAVKGNFDEKYFDDYLSIIYIDNDENFIDNINSLLNLGYQSKEINIFYEKVPNSISTITEASYNKEIINYLTLPYFKEANLERYINYENNTDKLSSVYDTTTIKENYNYEDTVTFVNANLDKEYYKNDINLSEEEEKSIDVIVNKYYKLDKSYVPEDLTVINSKYASGTQKLRQEAATKFEEMCEDAKEAGYKILAGSTYRSYDYQLNLYNRYVKNDGFANAETYSARAGYSEHQLGLAVDVLNGKWEYLSENDKEYTWLTTNSYKYGFILRYPRGKEYITGYMFEDWHFRYLGTNLAQKVFDSGLTYDEYIARTK